MVLEEISSEGNKTEGENGFNKLVKELTASTIDFAKACFDVRCVRSFDSDIVCPESGPNRTQNLERQQRVS